MYLRGSVYKAKICSFNYYITIFMHLHSYTHEDLLKISQFCEITHFWERSIVSLATFGPNNIFSSLSRSFQYAPRQSITMVIVKYYGDKLHFVTWIQVLYPQSRVYILVLFVLGSFSNCSWNTYRTFHQRQFFVLIVQYTDIWLVCTGLRTFFKLLWYVP